MFANQRTIGICAVTKKATARFPQTGRGKDGTGTISIHSARRPYSCSGGGGGGRVFAFACLVTPMYKSTNKVENVFRLMGAAGTKLPDSPVGESRCGSHLTTWISGGAA